MQDGYPEVRFDKEHTCGRCQYFNRPPAKVRSGTATEDQITIQCVKRLIAHASGRCEMFTQGVFKWHGKRRLWHPAQSVPPMEALL